MLDRPLSFRTGAALLVLSLLGLAGAAAFLLTGESGPPPRSSQPAAAAETVPDAAFADFVGDSTCAGCHPAAFAAHAHSRHAITLHRMLAGQLPARFPDQAHFTDGDTGLQYALARRGSRYLFEALLPGAPLAEPAEFAFGSGKTGITLVSREAGGAIRELRMSYFPARRRWEVTPGQRGTAADPLGQVQGRAMAQRCFGCHSTVIAASQAAPQARFMGVGCEACHGPGRRHVEALQRGDPSPHIDNPGRWDGQRVNELCGRCHRTQQELDPLDTFSLAQTQRFQPLGLARSACFRRSAGRLSCVTCHDAHENARTDAAHYEAVCLSCHARTPERLNAVCPVNPRSGCITCHMPKREVVRGIRMADHWIRVVRAAPEGGQP